MRKIRLDPETLSVESFAANSHAPAASGTVHANAGLPLASARAATVSPTCRTNCDCTLACLSIAPCYPQG